MPDYKQLYALLLGTASEALEDLERNSPPMAAHRLRAGICQVEELVLSEEEKPI